MAADISTLVGLAPVEMIDLENYAINQPKPAFQLPSRGVYTLQAPASFPSEAFGVSKKGALSVQIDPTIVDGPHAGFNLKYTRVYASTFKRNGVTVSQLGDYLNACGVTGVFTTAQDLADAVELTAGLTFQAELDWKAYSATAGIDVEGMSKFPKLEDGSYQPWLPHPTETNEDGSPKRVWANVFVRNFLPRV